MINDSYVVSKIRSDYDKLTDEELVNEVKNGNKDAVNVLIERYKNLVNIKTSKYFIIGAEKEDIFQEGLIGLYKAIKNFNNKKDNSFKTFANLCIERQLITAVKTSNRQKNIPLNSYLSLDDNAYNNDGEKDSTKMIEILNNKTMEDPLETVTKKEYYKQIKSIINDNLSCFEKKVLERFSSGESYNIIAEKLDTQVKSVDNAIQRIRKKTIKNINNIEENN